MTRYIYILCIISIFACGGGNKEKKEEPTPKIEKANVTYEISATESSQKKKLGDRALGRAVVNETLNDSFALKNTGEKPLVILNIKSNCGCIFLDYKSQPIKSEESRIIKYKYKTGRKKGAQFSEITVTTNRGKYSVLVNLEVR